MFNRQGVHARAALLLAALSTASLAQGAGVDLAAGFSADLRRNTSGGLERGSAASGLLELGAVWSSESLIAGALVTTSASLIHTAGGDISGRYAGDLQGLNNIEADGAPRLYEFWSEIRFGRSSSLTSRVGFLDLNAEFDAPVTSSFFIGAPFGIGTDLAQTGENGPAVFPVTSLGIRLAGGVASALQWRIAALDGVPGRADSREFATVDISRRQGALLIGELEYTPRGFNKLAAGAWTYTAAFERIDASAAGDDQRRHGNHGLYAVADRHLVSMGGARLDGMVRAGVADRRFNAVNTYVGAAVVASHLSERRPDDALGIAIAHARTGSAFRRELALEGGSPRRSETQIELTWRMPLSGWLAMASSAQWINRPGADRSLGDALVVGVRFEMNFARHWPLLAQEQVPAADGSLVMSVP